MTETAVVEPSRGARFYKCALQVNPYDYLARHGKSTSFSNENDYNKAIVDACKANDIEVIAVTDHYCVSTAESLGQAARAAGIHVFPGFEAVTKDGVHLLCFFELDKKLRELERVLGDCGIHRDEVASPNGKYDVVEFLQVSKDWRAVCVAAHVASNGGLLETLSGQPAVNAWTWPTLLACAIPGPIAATPANVRPILENKNKEYKRKHQIAVINAQDVCAPEDLAAPGSSCWIKMTDVYVDGLHQAFLDPESRIRLASDPLPENYVEFRRIAWQGGFLDGSVINFNENLNVLIGGRGSGKSTIIESIRYVLGIPPLGDEAKKTHDGIIKQVVKNGTKISLHVRSYRPSKADYTVERTVPNPPIVRDEGGEVLDIAPLEIVPLAEVYGQHEISELTKSPEKLTRLLGRFVESDPEIANKKNSLHTDLEESARTILETLKNQTKLKGRLASLPALQETLRRYRKAGLETRLKEQSVLVREEQVLKTAADRIPPFREWLNRIDPKVPIDQGFLTSASLKGLPGKPILSKLNPVLKTLSREVEQAIKRLNVQLDAAAASIQAVQEEWDQRKDAVQTRYQAILRDLQKESIDGEEFISLRKQIEELGPLKDEMDDTLKTLKALNGTRTKLLADWQGARSAEFQELAKAAKKVSKQLANRVLVEVSFEGNREPLFQLLREEIGGRLSECTEALRQCDNLSVVELAQAIRDGAEALHTKYGIPSQQAERLAQADPSIVMRIEELDLPSTTSIKLNVAPEGRAPHWQNLEDLSTGQKATAILLLLLLESRAPLVVDQPEDDLDNRFITDGIVPKMREEKCRRQFVFATHNANIPVLGDAELIVGMSASGEASEGNAVIPHEHMGSIDAAPVRELVGEILEGGQVAFETRRRKYGF